MIKKIILPLLLLISIAQPAEIFIGFDPLRHLVLPLFWGKHWEGDFILMFPFTDTRNNSKPRSLGFRIHASYLDGKYDYQTTLGTALRVTDRDINPAKVAELYIGYFQYEYDNSSYVSGKNNIATYFSNGTNIMVYYGYQVTPWVLFISATVGGGLFIKFNSQEHCNSAEECTFNKSYFDRDFKSKFAYDLKVITGFYF